MSRTDRNHFLFRLDSGEIHPILDRIVEAFGSVGVGLTDSVEGEAGSHLFFRAGSSRFYLVTGKVSTGGATVFPAETWLLAAIPKPSLFSRLVRGQDPSLLGQLLEILEVELAKVDPEVEAMSEADWRNLTARGA